ncbi:MAG TPA: response regulator [Candidatus Omnitrophota bacterium]|nr:response regulator [Candidatus Omnitrophota bacterium]HPS20110.1 response regulator [Candidatus Omnitrophota bacterium]
MPKKIMIVDDSVDFVNMIKKRLELSGYIVVTANDGEDAMKKLPGDVDLIILDVMMPKVDGYTLLHSLRRSKSLTKAVPIIVISAKPELKDLFQIEGITEYLVKPVDVGKLMDTIQRSLGPASAVR